MTGLLKLDEENEIIPVFKSILKKIDCVEFLNLVEQLDNYLDVDLAQAQECLKTLMVNIDGTSFNGSFDDLKQSLTTFDVSLAKQSIQKIKNELLMDECKGCSALSNSYKQ